MSETSSEEEILDAELANFANEIGGIEGYAFQPKRSDFEDIWREEWGPGRASSDDSTRSSSDNDSNTAGRMGNTDWCHCWNCISMPTESECRCCAETQAVTQRMAQDENHCKFIHVSANTNCE